MLRESGRMGEVREEERERIGWRERERTAWGRWEEMGKEEQYWDRVGKKGKDGEEM